MEVDQLLVAGAISEIAAEEWDALHPGLPLLSHAWLSALEASGCVSSETGWQPFHLVLRSGQRLRAAMPLYLKSHSYGEYVFDWAWADAYARYGSSYYPKLLSAIPFTPVSGPRLLAEPGDIAAQALLLDGLKQLLQQHQLSSAHILFPEGQSQHLLQAAGWLRRDGVQFRWENTGYASFEAFLTTLSADKRKKIRQERSKLIKAGISVRRMTGDQISAADWDFFYQCYCNTYQQHRSTPYLNADFFKRIAEHMPQHLLMIMAEQEGEPVAAALNVYGSEALYGRYWGAIRMVPGLHFELCYYQGQEFCIEQGVRYFEGGAQGEHKLARGFKARPTCSYHHIAKDEFAAAIQRYLQLEAAHISEYVDELDERAPFRRR